MESPNTRPWLKHLLVKLQESQGKVTELVATLAQPGGHTRELYTQLNLKLQEVEELHRQLRNVAATQNVLETDQPRIDLILSGLFNSAQLLGEPPK